jgi:hypothetical protein
MKCQNCQHENPYGATVCESCGNRLMFVRKIENATDEKSQAITNLLIFTIIGFGISFLYLLVNLSNKLLGSFSTSNLYHYLNLITELSSIVMLIIFSVITKYTRVRNAFIVFLVLRIILFFGFRFANDFGLS